MSDHKEIEFVWGVSPISIQCFQAAGLKTTSIGFQIPVSAAAKEILLQR